MNFEKMVEELKQRLNLVESRSLALEIELEDLTKEEEALSQIIKLYSNKEYDSIEEERRVTEALLNGKKKEEKEIKMFPHEDKSSEVLVYEAPKEIKKEKEDYSKGFSVGDKVTACGMGNSVGKITKIEKDGFAAIDFGSMTIHIRLDNARHYEKTKERKKLTPHKDRTAEYDAALKDIYKGNEYTGYTCSELTNKFNAYAKKHDIEPTTQNIMWVILKTRVDKGMIIKSGILYYIHMVWQKVKDNV